MMGFTATSTRLCGKSRVAWQQLQAKVVWQIKGCKATAARLCGK